MAQAMVSDYPQALANLAPSVKHDPRLHSLKIFFRVCRRVSPSLLRRGHLDKSDGLTMGPSSCLGGLAADVTEQPSPQVGIQDMAHQEVRALSPNVMQHSMG